MRNYSLVPLEMKTGYSKLLKKSADVKLLQVLVHNFGSTALILNFCLAQKSLSAAIVSLRFTKPVAKLY